MDNLTEEAAKVLVAMDEGLADSFTLKQVTVSIALVKMLAISIRATEKFVTQLSIYAVMKAGS